MIQKKTKTSKKTNGKSFQKSDKILKEVEKSKGPRKVPQLKSQNSEEWKDGKKASTNFFQKKVKQ